jgi:hypothetical protein
LFSSIDARFATVNSDLGVEGRESVVEEYFGVERRPTAVGCRLSAIDILEFNVL